MSLQRLMELAGIDGQAINEAANNRVSALVAYADKFDFEETSTPDKHLLAAIKAAKVQFVPSNKLAETAKGIFDNWSSKRDEGITGKAKQELDKFKAAIAGKTGVGVKWQLDGKFPIVEFVEGISEQQLRDMAK